jgi:hypothetical protein
MKLLTSLTAAAILAFGATLCFGQTVTSTNASGGTTTTTPATDSGAFGHLGAIAKDITSGTNWAVVAGGGRATSGNRNVAFAAVAYSFQNGVGIIAGEDVLFGKGKPQAAALKGGVTLQTTIHPLAFIGTAWATNILGQPFVGDLLATPKGNNGIGNIMTTGINFDFVNFGRFAFGGGFQYENRSGQGPWSGNYVLGHLAFRRTF